MSTLHRVEAITARALVPVLAGLAWIGGTAVGAEAQTGPPSRTGVEASAARATAEPLDRPVLTNTAEIAPLVRRWYRALDLGGQLGEGTVLLRLRVEPDGSVGAVELARPGPHHPLLNRLAVRAARRLRFRPPEPGGTDTGEGAGWWIHQRVTFTP